MTKKHRLFLGMYSFKIKKRTTSNKDVIGINDFLSRAYPDLERRFEKGFVQDIINLFDLKLFKTKDETHGGILEEMDFSQKNRTFDLMINGGVKGLKHYLINEEGGKAEISDSDIIGLKFFARIWMPAGSDAGYIFIQRYNNSSLKPLFDSIVQSVLDKYNFILAGGRIEKTTTEKRQKKFLNKASVKEITVIIPESAHDTGLPTPRTAYISLKRVPLNKEKINRNTVMVLLERMGIKVERDFSYQTLYETDDNGYREEKTVKADLEEKLIPNTLISSDCIDENNHPIFKKMQMFATNEMEQVLKELIK